jgi:serine protease Do
MDENMRNGFDMNSEDEVNTSYAPEQEKVTPPENNTGYTQRPVTPPTGYSSNYNPQYTYNSQANQYMPYGSYNYANQNLQPEKKKSKGKKKGGFIAAAIIILVGIISFNVILSSFSGGKKPQSNQSSGDDTQMNLVETPNKGETIKAEDVASAGDVYKKVKDSSVGVLVYTKNQQSVYSEGTGVVMGLNGEKNAMYIITCAHVIDARNAQIIVQSDDGTQYDAVVVGTDAKTDIGLLRLNTTELQPAEFVVSNELEVSDTIYAIGNPGGTQFFGSFTNGMVSAIGRPIDSPVGYEVACVQHTAAINPGNSGGALVNEYGQVVGINSSKIASTEYEGMGFAVPTSTVKEVVDELIKNGYVSNRPVLGVSFLPATQNQTYSIIVKANKLPAGSIVIDSIMNGSDLLNTEVKEGDMITAVNGKELDTYEVLLEVIENGKVGDTLKLTICRVDANYNISTFDVTVKLVEDSMTSVQEEETTDNGFYFPFGN